MVGGQDGVKVKHLCACIRFHSLSRYLGKVEHYRIIRDDKDYVSADGEEFFENLIQLVEVCAK